MARALEWAVNRQNDPQFLVVNAGSNEWNYQVIDLAKAAQKVMPDVEINVNPNAQPDNRSYKVDFSLFKKLAPDYYPIHDLDTTIKELIQGLNAIGFNDPDFRNSNLIRLKALNRLLNEERIDLQLRAKN